MVAIFTGLGAGFVRGSSNILGGAGQLGNASLGRAGEAISVNAATGNLLVSQQDEFLVGRGLDIGVSRTYNSLADAADGDNGDQWQQSTTRRVFGLVGTQNAVGTTIKRQAADGSIITHTWNATKSAYVTTDGDGAHDMLSFASGVWTWTDGSSQITESYSAYGTDNWRIAEQKDTDGFKLTFTYSGANLDKVTTANGEWTQYSWAGSNISQITTGFSNGAAQTLTRTRYAYDAQNRLSQVVTDLSPGDNVIADGKTYVTTYTYKDATGKQIATIAQSDGSLLSVNYESTAATARVTSLTQTAASGDTRVTTLSYSASYTNITAPDGQITRMDYDAQTQLTKITAPPAFTGAVAQTVQFEYDASGNVTKVTDAAGKITAYTFDANGNMLTSTDPNSNVVTRTYDAKNSLLTSTMTGSDASGAAVSHTTRYAYDIENHLRYSVSAEGYVTEYRYDVYGQLQYTIEYPEQSYAIGATALTEAALNTWRDAITDRSSTKIKLFSYDARGNQTALLNYGYATVAGAASTAEGFSRTHYTYDQAGQLLTRYNEGEISETFVYDGMGRLTSSVDLAGGTTSFVFNDAASTTVVTTASGYVTTSTYNKAGELISQLGSGSFDVTGTSTYKYDKNGRIRQSTDSTGVDSYYLYDKAGRKIADINDVGGVTEYRYDAAGRIAASITHFNAVTAAQLTTLANPNSVVEISTMRPATHVGDIRNWSIYDAGGRLIQSIDGTGGVARFEYDGSNRLIRTTNFYNKLTAAQLTTFQTTPPIAITLPTANAAKDAVSRTFYDRDGRLIGSLDGEGFLSEIVYDKAGQKVTEIAYATATTADKINGTFTQLRAGASPTSTANRKSYYVYDGQGILRYSINAQGKASSFTYNNTGKLTKTVEHAATIATTTTDYSYDNIKALVTAVANATNDRTSSVAYNSAGQITSTTDVAGLVTSFTYDNRGQVIKTVTGSGATARTARNYYTAGGDLRFSVDAEGYARGFVYDAEGRVTTEQTWPNSIVTTDATTITQVNSLTGGAGIAITTSYTYDAAGRPSTTVDGDAVSSRNVYNAVGQVIEVFTAEKQSAVASPDVSITRYEYDGAARVTKEIFAFGQPEVATIQYTYDGLGNRISVTDALSRVTTYTYDELGQVLTMADAAGGVTTYEYNAFGQVVKVTDARGNSSYNYYDNLGRVTQTTDASGVATTSAYTSFGELASVTRAGATTSFQYDKRGLVTRSTDALGFYETYAYDAFGNRTSKTAKSVTGSAVTGGTTTYTYDRRGLLLSEVLPVASYNNGGGLVSSTVTNVFEYDARGNRTKMVEANGLAEARTTQYAYDKNNRLIQTTGQTFLGQTPVEYIYYDARGNVSSTVNAAGGRTVFYYDDLGRKTVEISAVGTYTKYSYDKVGNVTEIRIYENAVGVPADGGSEEEAPGLPGGGSRYTTFVYDSLNRMTSSSVHGAKSGYWNGSSWVADTSAITTTYQYDANGNVVKLTDGYGNATWSYYDSLGRKTAQVDQENYITAWTYNAEGNVLSERRYVNKAAAPSSTAVPPAVTANASLDRITDFTYDLNGNRTVEIRRNVLVHNGSGAAASADAIIGYSYNGLGQVTRKTEATGDFVDYAYDAAGRLTVEARKAFTDQTGALVTPTVDYYYNGVNNLSRTRARGSGDSAERVTMYGYDGDKLRWVAGAEGQYRYYWYDQGGRQTYDYNTRTKSDGSADTSYNGNLTSYDVAGRVVSKWQADYTGNTWTTKGPVTQLTYNAFGDVIGTYVGGLLQQQNVYDLAGRMTATQSGDGIWKMFGYDKNGTQTVALTSAGAALGPSFDAALAAVGQENINASYTVYDKRNMATTVVEEGRRFSAGGALQNVTTSRAYNAFGEVATETNGLGHAIIYTYNNMGRVVLVESPAVEIVGENGVAQTVRPTESYYYDASGRLVATRDANGSYSGLTKVADTGNLTRLSLLAGTGYGGGQALVTAETHADGGVKQTRYDIHGDARLMIDEIGRSAARSYDRMGRAVSVGSIGGLVDYYAYDILGQQIRHWNSYLGAYEVETTDYDIQGRVISQRSFGGDVTTTSYSWNENIGVWVKTTTMANGLYTQEKTDFFGRILTKRDLGGRITDYGYDGAGRMSYTFTGGMLVVFGWYNSGHQAWVITSGEGSANYDYNLVGNRISEYATGSNGAVIKNQTAAYDALGRMISWNEVGNAIAPAANNVTSYDAAGNIRRTVANFYSLDAGGGAAYYSTRDYWFRYDAMNRVVTNRGTLSGGAIVKGSEGSDITYNAAGERASVTRRALLRQSGIWRYQPQWGGAATYWTYREDLYGGTWSLYTHEYFGDQRESYTYDAGKLESVSVAQSSLDFYDGATSFSVGGIGASTRRSSFTYDLMGRSTGQTDYDTDGTTAIYSRSAIYNAKGQLTSDYASTKKADNKTYATSNAYTYTDYYSGQYMLGSVAYMTSSSTVDGGSSASSQTINSYVWRDNAVQSHIAHTPNTSQSTVYNTSFTLNALGQLTSVYIADGKPRSVTFTLDELGQIIRRDESAVGGQTGSPHEVWYRFNGRQLGYTGNNGTSDVSYDASVAERRIVQSASPGTYRGGQLAGSSYADFAQSYDPINSYAQGSAGGSYNVRQGDTLQGIAQALWGDSSLWYKLAEANGMSASTGLIEGQTLILPTGVMRSKHNAGTFKPYDPTDAIGDLSPTAPKPPKKAKCGVLGQILQAVVTIAVTALLMMTPLAPVAPIIGNAVGQGFGMVTGIQQGGFNWKSLGMAAVATLVGNPAGGFVGSMVANAAVQGIGVATGLQKKFSWAGVAAAGIGAVVGDINFGSGIGGQIAATSADVIAQAATRSVIEGSSFGDNLIAQLPSAIGNMLGRATARGIATALDGVSTPARQVTADPVEGGGSALSLADIAALDPITQDRLAGDIIVTGSRRQSDPLDLNSTALIASVNRYNLKNRIIQDLHNQHVQAQSPILPSASFGKATAADMLSPSGFKDDPNLEGVPVIAADFTPWQSEYDSRLSGYTAHRAAGQASGAVYDPYNHDWVMKGFDQNQIYINKLDAIAERMVWDVASAGLSLDLGTALHRVAANGESTFENYLTIGTSALPLFNPLAKVGGKLIGNGVEVAAESATPVMGGIVFENAGIAAARSEAFLPGESVRRLSVRAFDDAGNLLPGRTVLDLAGNRTTGGLGALEFKLHEGVSLTARQAEHFPYLLKNGGQIVGNNGRAIGLFAKSPIGPLDVQRINGPTLPATWWPK